MSGSVRDTIRNAQDVLCRVGMCRRRHRVYDAFRSFGGRPVQPGPSLGELAIEHADDLLRRVILGKALREQLVEIRRMMWRRSGA